MRSVICITSSMSCEMKITLEPGRRDRSHQRRKSLSTPSRGRKGVGSSRRTSPGLARCAGAPARFPRKPARSRAARARPAKSDRRARRDRGRGRNAPAPRRAGARSARQLMNAARCGRQLHEPQIFEHRQRRHEAEILMHEAHAEAAEIAGLERQMHGLAVEFEATAGVGSMKAGEDLDQRRLARSVLAEQAVDFARHDRERHVAKAPGAAECSCDSS